MFTPSVKRNVFAGLALVIIAIVAIAMALFLARSRPIKILDTRFHVISVTASRGTNQPIYFEGPVVGRMKESLGKIGLGGQPSKKVRITLANTSIAFSVVYSGNFGPQELQTIQAELEDSDGKITRLEQGTIVRNPKENNYLKAWIQLAVHQQRELLLAAEVAERRQTPHGD
ncbi:MAG: hypothetical protein JWM68_5504 [Verrucomicrobiales bacterium]|nr:hypothetical protein [Verrucomicrobiales bacterium]